MTTGLASRLLVRCLVASKQSPAFLEHSCVPAAEPAKWLGSTDSFMLSRHNDAPDAVIARPLQEELQALMGDDDIGEYGSS